MFTGSWKRRQLPLICAMMGLGGSALMVYGMLLPTNARANALRLAPLALLYLAAFIYGIWGMIESFARFTVDDTGITKSGLFGTSAILWDRLAAKATSGLRGSTVTLTDDAGKRMALYFGLISDPTGQLHSTLAARCGRLDERSLSDTAGKTLKFYPTRLVGIVFMIGGPIFLLPVLPGVLSPSTASAASAQNMPYVVFFVLISIATFISGVVLAGRTVLLTPTEILDRNLFGERRMSYQHIESASTRYLPGRSGEPVEVFVIEAGGRKIAMPKSTRDYDLLRNCVLSRIPQSAQVQGERPANVKLDQAKAGMGVSIVLAVLVLMLAGVFILDSQQKLAVYRDIDLHGVHTRGRVTFMERSPRSGAVTIDYAFEAGGISRPGRSNVDPAVNSALRPGDTIDVIYVPADPKHCMAALSIGPRAERTNMTIGWVLIGVALLLPAIGVGAYFAVSRR